MSNYAARRAAMVENQLRARGIWDERVLGAMGAVPREEFVPRRLRHRAYADSALPIGGEQTISQPWIVAAICQELALTGGERVLEVGTGSGYSAAVLALLAAEVISIERDPELARAARRTLARLAVANVHLELGDGSLGDFERAPFEAIAVHAAAPGPPPALVDQLGDGGRLVVPLLEEGEEMLVALHRHGERMTRATIAPCRFVPLIGEGGFAEA
ncbi:MAG: protein-L-isoaspartate(D-aspartate) O-methyltransferase [Actinobacteria bacterium]|nr:protein-L-isoaspartate(D-aspartate) O-methyltransferase [Actinomycetota bacterium]